MEVRGILSKLITENYLGYKLKKQLTLEQKIRNFILLNNPLFLNRHTVVLFARTNCSRSFWVLAKFASKSFNYCA